MATPLADYKNGRLLITASGARGGPETGYKRQKGSSIVVDLFLKQVDPKSVFKQVTTASVTTDYLQGYIVGYVELPDGEDWLSYDSKADPAYDDSGLRPDAMYKGGNAVALRFGSRTTKSASVVEAAGLYDDGGIGNILRSILGDRIILSCEWRQ